MFMNPPLDYAINAPDLDVSSLRSESGAHEPVTFAALLDRHDAELPITDAMIREACARMDAAQPFPFSSAPISSLRTRFRAMRQNT